MMNKLIAEVSGLADNELARASAQWGSKAASGHEGYALILEELEEAAVEFESVKQQLEFLWLNIKANDDGPAAHHAEAVKRKAILAACEMIQTAAMAQKTLNTLQAAVEQTKAAEEAPATTATYADPNRGAKGLLRLKCRACGNEFGKFLQEYQQSVACKCGSQIDLTAPLASFRFTCPYCGKEGWGKTNAEDAEITTRCKCGSDLTLEWNPEAREYRN